MARDATESSPFSLLTRFRAWLTDASWAPGALVPSRRSAEATRGGARGRVSTRPAFTYAITIAKVGQIEVPAPLVFRTSSEDDWRTLYFYFVVIRGGGKTLVINTGLPEDLSQLNHLWSEIGGPRCRVTRRGDERLGPVLVRLGLNPRDVDYVVATPFKDHLLANLAEFPNAVVCVSQHGWSEHYLARRYPSPAPDHISVSDEMFNRLQAGTPNTLRLLKDDDEILPGVRALWVGVHDRSTMAIVVHTEDGDVVITDACLMYEHIERMVPLGTADSLEACLNGFMVVRQAGEFILPLYDPLAMERREAWHVG